MSAFEVVGAYLWMTVVAFIALLTGGPGAYGRKVVLALAWPVLFVVCAYHLVCGHGEDVTR